MAENAYETGRARVIPAVLVYLRSNDPASNTRRPQTLMMHRVTKPNDVHEGKWNGLGGKMDPGESPLEAAAREIAEESGLTLDPDRFKILGTLVFPAFKPSKADPTLQEDWWVVVLTADIDARERAQIHPDSPEGRLQWIDDGEVLNLNVWEGDRAFLPKVLERKPLFGTFWYEQGELKRFDLELF